MNTIVSCRTHNICYIVVVFYELMKSEHISKNISLYVILHREEHKDSKGRRVALKSSEVFHTLKLSLS